MAYTCWSEAYDTSNLDMRVLLIKYMTSVFTQPSHASLPTAASLFLLFSGKKSPFPPVTETPQFQVCLTVFHFLGTLTLLVGVRNKVVY